VRRAIDVVLRSSEDFGQRHSGEFWIEGDLIVEFSFGGPWSSVVLPVAGNRLALGTESGIVTATCPDGVVAQLVERLVRNEKVRGSTPLGSTILKASERL
jgi:hypothetical protein